VSGSSSEIRQDIISKRWVIYRNFDLPLADRFVLKQNGSNSTTMPHGEQVTSGTCPYCPGNESLTAGEIMAFRPRHSSPDIPSWWVRVIEDRDELLSTGESPERTAAGIYDRLSGYGKHEILIETPHHEVDSFIGENFHVREAFFAYQNRIRSLKRDKRIKYVSFTRFQGEEAGQIFPHSYGHILASPVISKRINQELNNALEHYSVKERCIFCDMLAQELEMEERIVAENEHYCVINPFASRIPFEMILLPNKHNAFFEEEVSGSIHYLAEIISEVITMYREVLDKPAYVFSLHNGPNILCKKLDDFWQTLVSDYHWHCEIIPILKSVAAFEVGTGIFMNSVRPEEATSVLKEGISLRQDKDK